MLSPMSSNGCGTASEESLMGTLRAQCACKHCGSPVQAVAKLAKKVRPGRRPAGRRNEQPTGGAGLFSQRNAHGSVGAALAIGFRE